MDDGKRADEGAEGPGGASPPLVIIPAVTAPAELVAEVRRLTIEASRLRPVIEDLAQRIRDVEAWAEDHHSPDSDDSSTTFYNRLGLDELAMLRYRMHDAMVSAGDEFVPPRSVLREFRDSAIKVRDMVVGEDRPAAEALLADLQEQVDEEASR